MPKAASSGIGFRRLAGQRAGGQLAATYWGSKADCSSATAFSPDACGRLPSATLGAQISGEELERLPGFRLLLTTHVNAPLA